MWKKISTLLIFKQYPLIQFVKQSYNWGRSSKGNECLPKVQQLCVFWQHPTLLRSRYLLGHPALGCGQLGRTFKILQTRLKLLVRFEAALKVSLVVSIRLLDSPSHASSLTAKMGVSSLWSRGVNSEEDRGHRIFAARQREKRCNISQGAWLLCHCSCSYWFTMASPLGLEINSILSYICSKENLCQSLSQEAALQFHKAAFTILPHLVKKAAESYSSAKT